jgi:hypothetical protein
MWRRSQSMPSRIVTSSLVFVSALLISVSCVSKPAAISSNQGADQSQSAQGTDIKSQWEQSCKTLNEKKLGRDYPGRKLDILVQILGQTPTSQVDAERERIRRVPNDYPGMEEYDRTLLQALVLISERKKDRDGLVYLLSAKCPRFIAGSAIELEIASLDINEPFLILIDSYQKASDERRYLAGIIRDSLGDLSEKNPDDSKFVAEARDWYLANFDKIAVNPYYHPFGPAAEQRNLFIPKTPKSPSQSPLE